MAQPLVIAYHLIWTGYGWWLPNDPRGSGSTVLRNDILAQLGELHHGRKVVQPPRRVVQNFLQDSEPLLKHPRLSFDEPARASIAAGFQKTIETESLTCYGCAIMPDHVHLLIRKHKLDGEDMIALLQGSSRDALGTMQFCDREHPVWATGGWNVFLDHPDEIRRTLRYIEDNPVQIGLPKQTWPFVKAYDGWPLHAGHSPNSPYVRALKSAGRYP